MPSLRRTVPLRPTAPLSPLLLTLCLALAPLSARADRGGPEVTNGGRMQTYLSDGRTVALPLKHTAVEAEVAGVVASVKVVQKFHNPFNSPIEAVYVFPLPHRAAVHAMTMQVGKRRIKGVVKTRAEAKKAYQRAKRQGKTAALLDQERPNIFTQKVANILPGDQIEVTLRYVETLLPEGGRYEFVYPMVVGPRYVGGGRPSGSSSGTGWGQDTDRIPDASRITPRLLKKGLRPGYDISLRLRINGGVPVHHVHAVAHKTYINRSADGSRVDVVLDARDAIPNKDFVVRYQLAGGRPEVALLAHRSPLQGHFLLMIQPKAKMTPRDVAPREYVFVVDNSGSMGGFPLQQARALVSRALRNLRPTDTFQIIKFAGAPDQFAPRAVQASSDNVARAITYVGQMYGGGGTEFLPALNAALTARKDPERARVVLFITDGYIGYEREVLRYLRQNIAGVNLFALGIGASVNRFLIDGMARIGSGAPFYLLNSEQAASVVERVFATISRPALTDIALSWDGVKVADITPSAVPDLFGERPVVLAGRYRSGGKATLTVTGKLAAQPFSRTIALDLPTAPSSQNAAVPLLWARRSIAQWMDTLAVEPTLAKEMERKVTDLALSYSLISRFTSMVAVDEVVRNPGGQQQTTDMPVPLPEGVEEGAAPKRAYQASNAGVLKGLYGIKGPNTAVGADAEDALGGLIGDQVGESHGVGGLGLRGTGRGGSGVGRGSIGIGSLGTIGKGGSSGSGAGYGRGGGGLRSRRARVPRVVMGRAVVTGSLDKNIIRRVIRRHINEARYCYQKELQANPKLAGKVTVKFVIDAEGKVVSVKVSSTTLNNKAVEACLLQAVKRWRFPKVVGGGVVVVNYPFTFRPSK